MSGPVYGCTCEGCEHVIAEAWAKGKTAHRCNAPGLCGGTSVFSPIYPGVVPETGRGRPSRWIKRHC